MRKIFVSSTFSDMQEERNLLHTRVMPEINSRLREDGDYAQFLDFRWGIDTENLKEDAAMQKVLSTCFDGISNSSYVIVFIGDNYGTSVPCQIMNEICEKYEIGLFDVEKSITELEITFATEKDVIDKEKVIFYFKSNSGNNIDSRVAKLKKHIEDLYPGQIRYYNGELDKHSTEFVDGLVSDIWELISLENDFTSVLDELSHNYALRWSSRYELMEEISHSALKNPLTVISGESGSGKTVFLSALREKLNDIAYTQITFVNKTNYNYEQIRREVIDLLLALRDECKLYLGSECFGTDYEKIVQARCEVLRKQENIKPFIMLIDGIDKFDSIDDLTRTMDFVDYFCEDVHFVLTVTNKDKYIFPTETEFFSLEPLDYKDKISAINKELELYQKSLDNNSIEKLLSKQGSNNPLYLRLAIKRLVMMQDEDYKAIEFEKDRQSFFDLHIESSNVDVGKIINEYIYKIIDEFPEDLEHMIVEYLEFSIKMLDDRDFALNIAAFMASSFFGYSDTEILLLIDKIGFKFWAKKFSYDERISYVPVSKKNPFIFTECEMYWFRKYLGDIIYNDIYGRNNFENTIVKETINRIYSGDICAKGISNFFNEPHEERVVEDLEIVAAIFRSYNFRMIFWMLSHLDRNSNDKKAFEYITKMFIDVFLNDTVDFDNGFFRYASGPLCAETVTCIKFCVTEFLEVLINSRINPLPFVSFFRQCLQFLKKKTDYSNHKNHLFIIMATLNISILLKNGRYVDEALSIAKEVQRMINAMPIATRDDMYYEAKEVVDNYLMEFTVI